MALYVPPTDEADHKKQNQSLQLIGGVTSTNTTNIATNTAAIAALNSGLYPGTITNDNAVAGNIGEYISSTVLVGSAVAVVTATVKDVTSISLTAGDWDVWGSVINAPNAATTTQLMIGWISTTSATLPTVPNGGAYVQMRGDSVAGGVYALPVGRTRLSLAVTTTVYLSVDFLFGVSTNAAYGFIGARRAR